MAVPRDLIDLASRRLIGWSMGDRHDATLVVDALQMAVAARGRAAMDGTIFHHDGGSEAPRPRSAPPAASWVWPSRRHGPARAWTTPSRESFFATLKVEMVHRRHFATRAEARRAIFAWVHRYNHRRRHSTIGMIPPAVYEQQHRHTRPLPSPVAA